jgi:hypothetical protein
VLLKLILTVYSVLEPCKTGYIFKDGVQIAGTCYKKFTTIDDCQKSKKVKCQCVTFRKESKTDDKTNLNICIANHIEDQKIQPLKTSGYKFFSFYFPQKEYQIDQFLKANYCDFNKEKKTGAEMNGKCYKKCNEDKDCPDLPPFKNCFNDKCSEIKLPSKKKCFNLKKKNSVWDPKPEAGNLKICRDTDTLFNWIKESETFEKYGYEIFPKQIEILNEL